MQNIFSINHFFNIKRREETERDKKQNKTKKPSYRGYSVKTLSHQPKLTEVFEFQADVTILKI